MTGGLYSTRQRRQIVSTTCACSILFCGGIVDEMCSFAFSSCVVSGETYYVSRQEELSETYIALLHALTYGPYVIVLGGCIRQSV
jgi:hypothetical protein